MTSDYSAIKRENMARFGTDIGRIGQMLLADRYGDRTHFIYELLQNAEDALGRRFNWAGPRSATFHLSESALRVSHFGIPFTEADVRSICGIAESTKDLTSIGRFGIGFKSVYAFTDSPQIHSVDEHFAIDSFVWPRAVRPLPTEPDQTVLLLGLRADDARAADEIATGLRRLGPRVLLFLRELDEVAWSIEKGASGTYLRERTPVVPNAERVDLVGQESGTETTEESWLVFSRAVSRGGRPVGKVEIAFALERGIGPNIEVRPIDDAPLVVFFPTIVSTNLGFLVQGPYRTTPSRDNVPRQDSWNQHLVGETATLLVEALSSLRDLGALNVGTLRSLPLDRAKFDEGTMFAPLFDFTKEALLSRNLLPRFGGGQIMGSAARLSRTQELRELISPQQLVRALGSPSELGWLSEEITQDRVPELRAYLMRELGVPELTWESFVPHLTTSFLESQTDEWITRLYETLSGQQGLLRAGRLEGSPLVRLENGSHVVAFRQGEPQAFLPSEVSTGFPTVSPRVLTSVEARAFLRSLGMTEPDLVDDIIRNVLPRYDTEGFAVPADYAIDIRRILKAFETDSKSRRETLVAATAVTPFVAAVDAGTGRAGLARPTDVYIATQKLKELFEGVAGVLVVDDSYDCLHGEPIRELLESSGASRYLSPISVEPTLGWDELGRLRVTAGWPTSTGIDDVNDFTLRGLDALLETIDKLDAANSASRARLLWEALCDLDRRSGPNAFVGTYTWFYFSVRSTNFDAAFVRTLNIRAWVPGPNQALLPPANVVFESLSPPWETNARLLSKIRFKPPILEALAREAGIELGLLDLLKNLGVTSAAQLRDRLQIADDRSSHSDVTSSGIDQGDPGAQQPRSNGESETPSSSTGAPTTVVGSDAGNGADDVRDPSAAGPTSTQSETTKPGSTSDPAASEHESEAPRVFVSYIGVEQSDENADPDGLGHQRRLKLESAAIDLILKHEPTLQRTALNNPGFDLVENDNAGKPNRWVEVKAMTGTLEGRPVGLSHTQFENAQEKGERYWLYVVENAGSPNGARVLRIRNPARRGSTFVFDRGWILASEPKPPT